MNASVLSFSNGAGSSDPAMHILYRVVKWNVNDPGQEGLRVLWEGHGRDFLPAGRSFGRENIFGSPRLPIFCPDTGALAEFQQLRGDSWVSAHDPRLKTTASNAMKPARKAFILDGDRWYWPKFKSCFDALGWRMILSHNLQDAGKSFASACISPRDIVVVGHHTDDGTNYKAVRALKRAFAGRIYGLAEKWRWRVKLGRAGCSAVFPTTVPGAFFLAMNAL